MGFTGAVEENALSELAKQGKYDEMPAPFGPKTVHADIGYYLQAVVIEKGANLWDIIKHYNFEEPQKLKFCQQQIAHGQM